MYQVWPCFAGENRKHWAMTLYYQRNISWPALDGLMIDCCSLIFQSGQLPASTASVNQKQHDEHCLLAGWPWLLSAKLFQMGQRLTDLVRLVSGDLIGKPKAPWVSAVKCSPVSRTDTLMFALSTIGSSAVSWKRKEKKKRTQPALCEKTLTMSSLLFSTWAGWIKSRWKYKWEAASTVVSSFLYLLIPCDRGVFFYLVTEPHRSWCIHDRLHGGSGYRQPCFVTC